MSSQRMGGRRVSLVACLVGGFVALVSAVVFGWSVWSVSGAESSVDESQRRADLTSQEFSTAKLDLVVAKETRDEAETKAEFERSGRMFMEGYVGTRESNQEQYDADIQAAQEAYDVVAGRFEDARSTSQDADRQLQLDRADLDDKESTSATVKLVSLSGVGVGAVLLVVGGFLVVRSAREDS